MMLRELMFLIIMPQCVCVTDFSHLIGNATGTTDVFLATVVRCSRLILFIISMLFVQRLSFFKNVGKIKKHEKRVNTWQNKKRKKRFYAVDTSRNVLVVIRFGQKMKTFCLNSVTTPCFLSVISDQPTYTLIAKNLGKTRSHHTL